ncbi:(3R)-3-hydroxyacyl-CoA dehydrogenase isoform X3 [Alligator mississippiensis]|uniref:(3R)-3-hydroxyacyl-CoA dehydrogenase isoform X3 n=1 Tax=Alligator mississippiensis TaxID=8496 RepID=UPI002877C523|nr:(3R)-3-hydroxyacyl-CoA dehydrogenase isoform X3 [Alligator mississippiensis]
MAAPQRLRAALALVTGGGGGIGASVCARLAREGARVAVADRDEAAAAHTARGLPRAEPGQEHEAFGVDVACARSVSQLLAQVQARFSAAPHVCVNCAGITRDEFLLKQTEAAFDEVIAVNLKGTFLVMQAVAQALVQSGALGGSIINLGSIVGKVGNLGQVNYVASKAGVEGLTKTAAKELARYGIRCNVVLPGFIRTPMTDQVPPKVMEKLLALVPMGRLGDPEEVADVCAFLASEESRYITGASVEVTGGLFL